MASDSMTAAVKVMFGFTVLALAGCGGTGLTTASLLSGSTSSTPAVEGPMDRSIHVANTSARAVKCGYYFDPQRLRQSFIASEVTRLGVEHGQKAEKAYDQTHGRITASLRDAQSYCTEERTATVRSDLQRSLAGNYEPRKKVATGGGLFDMQSTTAKPLDRDAAFNPNDPRSKVP